MVAMAPAVMPVDTGTCRFCYTREAAGPVVPLMERIVAAGPIVGRQARGYVIQAGKEPEPGYYLLVPWQHLTGVQGFPLDWESFAGELLGAIPGFGPDSTKWPDFCRYRLHGVRVGNSVPHVHEHVRFGPGLHIAGPPWSG
jgi:hypothetical protein